MSFDSNDTKESNPSGFYGVPIPIPDESSPQDLTTPTGQNKAYRKSLKFYASEEDEFPSIKKSTSSTPKRVTRKMSIDVKQK